VGQYAVLMDQILTHQRHLQKTSPEKVSLSRAAADWQKTIYRPLRIIIERGRLIKFFPGRSVDDLYVYISFHQWKKGRERRYGIGIDKLITKSMEAFRDQMAEIKEFNYPEMKRGITAFVLMNVQGKRENRIIDKLYDLAAVHEIHSVHGDIDVLVKVVLTRDLLSSDAEIISEFVHKNIRQIPGVISTKTLIPGLSRVKTGNGGE
jgi:DNA-binding Lrp family transcriptional regulator